MGHSKEAGFMGGSLRNRPWGPWSPPEGHTLALGLIIKQHSPQTVQTRPGHKTCQRPRPHQWVSLMVAHCRCCNEHMEGGDPSLEGQCSRTAESDAHQRSGEGPWCSSPGRDNGQCHCLFLICQFHRGGWAPCWFVCVSLIFVWFNIF